MPRHPRIPPTGVSAKDTLPAGSLFGSSFAPLALKRPLQVFAQSLDILVSTPLTFSPHTLLKAVMDTSIQSLLRQLDPDKLDQLRVLDYIARKKHQPTLRTRARLIAQMGSIVGTDHLERALNEDNPVLPLESQWTHVVAGLAKSPSSLRFVAELLEAWDAVFLRGRSLDAMGARAEVQTMAIEALQPMVTSWRALNAKCTWQAFIPVDSALQVMARLELRFAKEAQLEAGLQSRLCAMLLQPGQRPLGYWLGHVVDGAKARSLSGLSQALLRKGTQHLNRPITYSRIKQWSSSATVAIPATAALAVLEAVPIEKERQRLEALFYAARFLTFAIDVIWAGSEREIEWSSAQAQVKSRYESLYRTFSRELGAA